MGTANSIEEITWPFYLRPRLCPLLVLQLSLLMALCSFPQYLYLLILVSNLLAVIIFWVRPEGAGQCPFSQKL
jgi:hypothetical protein